MRDFMSGALGKVSRFIASRDKSTYLEKFLHKPWRRVVSAPRPVSPSYLDRLRAEHAHFDEMLDTNALPGIFHYWSHAHLRPMLAEFGIDHVDDWFARPFAECVSQDQGRPSLFASFGAGNCDTEVRVALRMKQRGIRNFTIECLDLNGAMLTRGKTLAAAEGVEDSLAFIEADLNTWRASHPYSGVMACQSLHHIVNLEGLFAEVRQALPPQGVFVINDTIGRNGHLRWPEALEAVHAFWEELPQSHRYNHALQRHEAVYENWDCSTEGFEGIRAQDILPLLVERFEFQKFFGFGNVIDPFVDRAFGHNFDVESPRDRDFIDRVHAFDERGFADGSLTPTHMFAVVAATALPGRQYSRGLSPECCIRDPAVACLVPGRRQAASSPA